MKQKNLFAVHCTCLFCPFLIIFYVNDDCKFYKRNRLITFFFCIYIYTYNAIDCAYILPLCLFVVFVDVHMIILKARIKEKNILRNRSRVSRHDFKSIGVGVYVYIYICAVECNV